MLQWEIMDAILISVVSSLIVSALTAFLVSIFRIGEYKNKVDWHEATMGKDEHSGLRKTVGDMKSEVDKLLEFKTNAQKFMDKTIYKDLSPITLTDFGKQLLRESGFDEIFPSIRDDLVKKLEAEKPKTQYDVQEKARFIMDNLTDYPAFQPLKKYAFDNGKDFQQILRAGAIPLRDYYLEVHQEMPE